MAAAGLAIAGLAVPAVAELGAAFLGGGVEVIQHPGQAPALVRASGFWGWLINGQRLQEYELQMRLHQDLLDKWNQHMWRELLLRVLILVYYAFTFQKLLDFATRISYMTSGATGSIAVFLSYLLLFYHVFQATTMVANLGRRRLA